MRTPSVNISVPIHDDVWIGSDPVHQVELMVCTYDDRTPLIAADAYQIDPVRRTLVHVRQIGIQERPNATVSDLDDHGITLPGWVVDVINTAVAAAHEANPTGAAA